MSPRGVHHGHADAVKAAGDLVAAVIELAAGVRSVITTSAARSARRVLVHRDAAAVVDHGDRVVDVDGDVDLVAVAGERLVDRVVDDLVDQMMQAGEPSRPMTSPGRFRTASRPSRTLILSELVIVLGPYPYVRWRRWSRVRPATDRLGEPPDAASFGGSS